MSERISGLEQQLLRRHGLWSGKLGHSAPCTGFTDADLPALLSHWALRTLICQLIYQEIFMLGRHIHAVVWKKQ